MSDDNIVRLSKFVITVFYDVAASEKIEKPRTLKSLAELVGDIVEPAKEALPLLKFARFGDTPTGQGSLRSNANVVAITGVEADYDGEKASFDDAVDILDKAGVKSIVYTSPSHTPDKPRWRVCCPTSCELVPDQRDKLMGRLIGLFAFMNIEIAPESWTLSQAYYFGSVAPNDSGNPNHQVEVVDGDFIDLCEFLDGSAAKPPNRRPKDKEDAEPQGDIEDIEAALELIPNDDREWDGYAGWNYIGMAVYRASGGSVAGFDAFNAWSKKATKYKGPETRERWEHWHGSPPTLLGFGTLVYLARETDPEFKPTKPLKGVSLDDFYAYMPQHNYLFTPTGEPWPASSVNARIAPVDTGGTTKKGDPVKIAAAAWLDVNRAVEQMTWVPGLPMIIKNRLTSHAGWIERTGVSCFNLYRPSLIKLGDADQAGRWVEHIKKIYPDDEQHIRYWLAHRVQRPGDKINHALMLGGAPGIGKDTILEPIKRAVGHSNWQDISPSEMSGQFNQFAQAVILRINEGHDLGDISRYQFYEHIKIYTAAPPDVLRINKKFINEYYIANVCGVIITTNHRTDGMYLPPDDRRHYVAWSNSKQEDFTKEFWDEFWDWYANGGYGHVAAYLQQLDISEFNSKAPPEKTPAFWAIADAGGAPEGGDFREALEKLKNPDAVMIADILDSTASGEFLDWLRDKKNYRAIPHRLEECGYVAMRNPDDKRDGFWAIGTKKHRVYAKNTLTPSQQIAAVRKLLRLPEKVVALAQASNSR